MSAGLFATKPVDKLVADTKDESSSLQRAVGLLDLTALGIGAIIGTSIFVILGEAIGDSGPAIILSFVLAGVTCAFSALSYAELASSIPVSGSAYTYGYATMGELLAWIIGWDLILEYAVSVAAIAVGWASTSTTCSTACSASSCRRRSPPRPARAAASTSPPCSWCWP
jgi:basic amino acid/polyamine antiporter, APA family